MKDDRIAWVDTLRFLGMLAIYAGHFGDVGGRFFQFVWIYHVSLFFFAAGFFARADEPLLAMAWRLVRRLLAPYIFFALLYAATAALLNNWAWTNLEDALVAFSFGIRNQVPAGSLWFFPCLFVAALAFGVVLRLTRSALAGLVFGGACLLVAMHGLSFNPLGAPSWPMNVDSALYYVWWYALGHAAFPHLQRVVQRPWFAVVGTVPVLATGWLYFNGAGDVYALANNLAPGSLQQLSLTAIGVLVVGTIILGNVALARAIDGVQLLRELGQRTLLMCGTENFTKLVLGQAFLIVGLKFQLANPLQVIVYSFACMLFSSMVVGRVLEMYAPKWTSLRIRSRNPAVTSAAIKEPQFQMS